MLPAFVRTYYCFTAQLFKERETHICKCRLSVHARFLLHYGNKVVESVMLFFRDRDFFLYQLIVFNKFCCGESNGKSCRLDFGFKKRCRRMNTAVYCGDRIVRDITVSAEVHASRLFTIPCDMYCVVDKLIDTLILNRRYRHYGYTEYTFKVVYMDRTAVCFYLVHHVEGEYHRNTEFHQLHGKIKVTFDIRCVNYIDNTAEIIVKKKVTGHYLFARIR